MDVSKCVFMIIMDVPKYVSYSLRIILYACMCVSLSVHMFIELKSFIVLLGNELIDVSIFYIYLSILLIYSGENIFHT